MSTSIDVIMKIFWNNSILYRYFLKYLDSKSLVQFAYINKEIFKKRQFILNIVFSKAYDLIRYTQNMNSSVCYDINKLHEAMLYYNWIRGDKVNVHILFQNSQLQKKMKKCMLKNTPYILNIGK